MKGYTVVAVFNDDVSGGLIDRPGMKAMLTHLGKHRAKRLIVIIDDISRLARDVGAHLSLRADIAEAGGVLESPSIEFGEDSDSRLIENLLASVSQHQRQKNGEQTRNRMRARLLNGYWPFPKPVGYRYQRATGQGMVLVRDEPVASAIQEALEGYAFGHLERQADVARFLAGHPAFPKSSVTDERARQILTNRLYAGHIEHQEWDVSLRPAQHEGLISYATFQRVQERLKGNSHTPKRPNLAEDFPLRGFVLCDDCGTPLTGYWAKGSSQRYAYYHCPKPGCVAYGKSIRRADIEGEFEALLRSVGPSEPLFRVTYAMFKDLWTYRAAQARSQAQALAGQLAKTERQIEQLVQRILGSDIPTIIAAYEERVRGLEGEKVAIKEKLAASGSPARDFDKTFRTAMDFLANPYRLWDSARLEDRRRVLKLTFATFLRYRRSEGFRTTQLSLPFKVMADVIHKESEMALASPHEVAHPQF